MTPPDDGDLHDGRHPDASIEEWVFAAWTVDGSVGVVSGHRLFAATSWYWAALAREGRPLLHITDFEVPVRADPFILKGEAMWAEHFRDEPMTQWTVGNETYASAIDDPDEALGRAYGHPTPIAFDLEWYAVAPPTGAVADDAGSGTVTRVGGYTQSGVVHGAIEILGEPPLELVEVPARRWHRWTTVEADPTLAPLRVEVAMAHTGVRAPFAFPDGSVLDLVLTPDGWRRRPSG